MTQALNHVRAGDSAALSRLWTLLYDDLRAVAHRALKNEPNSPVLHTTVVVHEAFLRLVDTTGLEWKDQVHFFRTAARVMRHLIVDWARSEKCIKRGGDRTQIPLLVEAMGSDENKGLENKGLENKCLDVIDLHHALDELKTEDSRSADVVELRFFAGLTVDETAKCLDVSRRTVEGDWEFARAWLGRKLRT